MASIAPSPNKRLWFLAFVFKGLRWHSCALLLCCALLCTACAQNASPQPAQHVLGWSDSFIVTFAPHVSYEQALRIVTNLGLQPSIYCGVLTNTGLARWQPMGQRETFPRDHQLFFVPGYLIAPTDWQQRLANVSGVVKVGYGEATYAGEPIQATSPDAIGYSCPPGVAGTPPPATLTVLSAPLVDFGVVTFRKSAVSYDVALYTVANLGLALSDPCYVDALQQGKSPAWHSMGQEDAFTTTARLVVQTQNGVTSNQWQEQIRAAAGVISLETSAPQC